MNFLWMMMMMDFLSILLDDGGFDFSIGSSDGKGFVCWSIYV